MSGFNSEHQRYEEGVLGRDLVLMTPEAIAIRDLIDHLGELGSLAIKASEEAA